MERMRVIAQVKDHTSRYAGMVGIPKKTGDVRICVDLKPLNENVQRGGERSTLFLR